MNYIEIGEIKVDIEGKIIIPADIVTIAEIIQGETVAILFDEENSHLLIKPARKTWNVCHEYDGTIEICQNDRQAIHICEYCFKVISNMKIEQSTGSVE